MTEHDPGELSRRVLFLAPTAKDAELTRTLLQRAEIACTCCSDMGQLCRGIDEGAAAILLPEEAIQDDESGCLADKLGRQQAWSEVPVLLLARTGVDSATIANGMNLPGSVTVLERPVRAAALVSALRVALRVRQQQYQIRDHLADQKAATEIQALLAAIVASSDDAIISKTLEGVIQTWNAGAERLFGYTRDEAVGQPITMLIPPERLDEERSILERLRNDERIEHFETVRVAKDGRRLDISLTVSPVRNADGRVVGASKVARDITQARRAAEALRSVSEQLEVVTDNMAVAVTQCDRDFRYRWVSRGCADWLGRAREEILGRQMSEIVGLAAFDGVRPYIERVLAGERVEFEAKLPIRGLGQRWIKAVYVPTHDRLGKTDGWVDVLTDTTTHHELEDRLRDADRRKDEFLAVLAHELRNPLAPIRNALQVLRLTRPRDPTTAQLGDLMERQVEHMVRLVDDLLEVSRITRGKIDLRREPVEIERLLHGAIDTSRPLIEAANHRLVVEIPPEPILLEGDLVRLTQVVSNLLNNAAKYTDKGGTIFLTTSKHGTRSVCISVRDTGAGIPPDMLGRIFEMFTQVDRGIERSQGGLGIGLTIVKTLVEMHGGTVEARSEGLGRGSEFVVRLPLPAPRRATEAPRNGTESTQALSTRRVLVVDDNRDAAESTGMLLRLLGAHVDIAFSGEEALAALALHKPNVVLLDIGMPGMSGHEVARRIRQRGEFQDVKLVALSGWGQAEDRQRSETAGFDHHLIKPADLDTLRNLLGSIEADPLGQS